MRSILSVTTAATDTDLTTLTRVKRELDLTTNEFDDLLDDKIAEASSDVEGFLGFTVALETVTETFWHEANDDSPLYFLLDRTPVTALASVTLDDDTVDPSLYRLDSETGELYALDAQGYPARWLFHKAVVVAYSGGYVLPAERNSTLPAGIEGATVELVTDFWTARGRDPSLRSEEVVGAWRADYWVGSVGDPSELPPRVQQRLARWRRAHVA